MDKKRLKIALAVLNAVRSTFSNEFTNSALKEECEKDTVTEDEVINLLQI